MIEHEAKLPLDLASIEKGIVNRWRIIAKLISNKDEKNP